MIPYSYNKLASILDGRSHKDIACPVCGPLNLRKESRAREVLRLWGGGGNDRELITYFCIRCGIKGYAYPGTTETPMPVMRQTRRPGPMDHEKRFKALWDLTVVLDGGSARYLSNRGHLTLPAGCASVRRLIRHEATEQFFPSSSDNTQEALVCAVADVDGKWKTAHLTYLTLDGCKAHVDPVRRFMAGPFPAGGAVRLGKPLDGVLGVAEGVETALSATALYDVPTWAALSASFLEKFQPPPNVRKVIVYADNDSRKTNQGARSAEKLTSRLQANGYEVEIKLPELPGDWNDVLKETQNGVYAA